MRNTSHQMDNFLRHDIEVPASNLTWNLTQKLQHEDSRIHTEREVTKAEPEEAIKSQMRF